MGSKRGQANRRPKQGGLTDDQKRKLNEALDRADQARQVSQPGKQTVSEYVHARTQAS